MVDQLNALRRRSEPRGARSRHRRQARRPGRRCPAWPARGRTSPTTSTRWPRTSPARSATSPTWRPPWPTATCRKKITVDVKGEILELKNTINTMVDQLNGFASRSDAAWRAKSAPKASSAARRRCAAWPARGRTSPTTSTRWPSNLTGQVRNIADVTTAVASGDLSPQDHGRREGRNPRAEEHHQHDGRSAQRLRRRK